MRVLVLAALVALGLGCDRIALYWIEPREAFDPGRAPAPPDYAVPASWSAWPAREAPADLFYVHPTSYVGALWNAPVDDPQLNADTDRVATGIQATAFESCCAVYAPRYRQANGTAFTHPSEDGQRALELAYGDIRAAFAHFVAKREAARPLLLAGHSQGSVLAFRLLAEEIGGTALREQLVAAWLIGAPITEAAALDQAGIPPCESAEQTGCVIGWNARGPGYVPGRFEFAGNAGAPLCINPISWRRDERAMPASASYGAVFRDAEPVFERPGYASAQCQGYWLVVTLAEPPPRDLASRLLDRVLGPGNFHAIEYQMFYADIRENAAERLSSWQQRR